MGTQQKQRINLSTCAGKECSAPVQGGNVVCVGCVDRLDGLLDEVQRIYPFLRLMVNATFASHRGNGVIDGSVNVTALEEVMRIDSIVEEMVKHVAERTSFIDFPRDAEGNIFDGFGMVTAYETPLPMGGMGFPTLRGCTWLRKSHETFTNLDHVAQLVDAGKLISNLRSAVEVAEDLTNSKAGRVLLGSCRHCNDERDLWLDKGAQSAVCRSCWKTNSLADNFRAAAASSHAGRLMTAPTISKALAAMDINVPATKITSWDANERRRVLKAEAKGKVVENRLPVREVITVKTLDGKGDRTRVMYSFDDVYAYWHRLHEESVAKAMKVAVVDDVMFEVTVK